MLVVMEEGSCLDPGQRPAGRPLVRTVRLVQGARPAVSPLPTLLAAGSAEAGQQVTARVSGALALEGGPHLQQGEAQTGEEEDWVGLILLC